MAVESMCFMRKLLTGHEFRSETEVFEALFYTKLRARGPPPLQELVLNFYTKHKSMRRFSVWNTSVWVPLHARCDVSASSIFDTTYKD